MEGEKRIAPFIAKPMRINNYTHAIALLKSKQNRYKDCTHGVLTHPFSKVLSVNKETLDLNGVLDGFLHQKIKEKAEEYEKTVNAEFLKSIASKIKELKYENDLKVHGLRIGNLKEVESSLFVKPSVNTFKDELLFDLYSFINQRTEPVSFLENSYLKFIIKFFAEDKTSGLYGKPEGRISKDDLKNIVKEFVKMKFNREEFNIEIYESRYLWAEVFVLHRIGRIDLVKELLSEFEIFFEFMAQKFKSTFLGFINGKKPNFVVAMGNEDRFKRFLFDLTEDKAKSDGHVINTVEDYLWLKLVSGKEIKKDLEQFDSNRIKFMIALFSAKYNKAIDILLKSDFGVVAKFFLLKELCLEQTLDHSTIESESINTFDKSNRLARQEFKSRAMVDDSSSTISMASASDRVVSTINPIFLNFLFNIVSKLSTREYKVKLVEMLKNHTEYYNMVPGYIIKYNLFDILGRRSENTSEVEFALDDRLASRVLEKLKETGDKQRLVQLHHLIDDLGMVQLLTEVVEETILIEESIDQAIVEKYLSKRVSRDSEKLKNVYNFYKFSKTPSSTTLKATIIFDQNVNLNEYKFIIEKVFFRAVDVVKNSNDKHMAKSLFRLCGSLGLNEECTNRISKDLVMLI